MNDPKPEVVYTKVKSWNGDDQFLVYVTPAPTLLNTAPMTGHYAGWPVSESWLVSFGSEAEAVKARDALQPHAEGLRLLLESGWGAPPGDKRRAQTMGALERMKDKILKSVGIKDGP